jgi:hypothetical protein
VSFSIAFGFEKVVNAWVDLGGVFSLQLFEPQAVGDEIGRVGLFLGRNSQKVLFECLEDQIFLLGKGHD